MRLAICVPLKCSNQHRVRNWHVCYHHLSRVCRRHNLDFVVAESGARHAAGLECRRVHVPAPFSICKGRNAAWRATDANHICFADSDFVMSDADWDRSITEATAFDVYSPYRQFTKLGPKQTKNRLVGYEYQFGRPVSQPPRNGNLCGGMVFCRRSFLDAVDGWDERFVGWGYEDHAAQYLAEQGGFATGFGTAEMVHLYHAVDKRGAKSNRDLLHREYRGRTFDDIMSRRKAAAGLE